MNGYKGSATVIASDGVERDAYVDLGIRTQHRDDESGIHIRQWVGTANIPDFSPIWLGDCVVRLPDGREGKAVLVSAQSGSSDIELRGSGAPPFGEV